VDAEAAAVVDAEAAGALYRKAATPSRQIAVAVPLLT
jgi:hypothetical protein